MVQDKGSVTRQIVIIYVVNCKSVWEEDIYKIKKVLNRAILNFYFLKYTLNIVRKKKVIREQSSV